MVALELRHTPVILAIESDSDQATWLASVVRRRVKAELSVARTVQEAVRTIASRVPDLILLPALLSPADEAALMGTVRGNPAAAHVQMLTIPVLTAHETPAPSRKLLGRFRRDKNATESPAASQATTFADDIATSLKRALDQRAPAAAAATQTQKPEVALEQRRSSDDETDSSSMESEPDAGLVLELAGEQTPGSDVFGAFSELAAVPEFGPPMGDLPHAFSRPMLPRPKRSAVRARKVQESWEGIDPLQCGFPMLLARLAEQSKRGGGTGDL